ncbi:MAG TPA: HD domain-containing protein [bacterium]|nr:HD domain-containing protein [bacterium]
MNVLERVRRWFSDIVALHERSPAEREDLRRLPPVLRGCLIVSCIADLYAITRVAPRDAPAVAALIVVYALVTLVPPIVGPFGRFLFPRLALMATIALLWSPLHTLIGVAFGTLAGVLVFRLYEPWRAVLNTVYWAYPAAFASLLGHAVLHAIPDPLVALTVASIVIVVVYWVMNDTAVALAHHLRAGVPFFADWWRGLTEDPVDQLLSAPLPIFLGAIGYGLGSRPWVVLCLTAVAALTIPSARAQRNLYFASQRTTEDMVHALMLALERAVPGAQAHAERVSALVGETGRRLRVPARYLEVWSFAALLHDIGLIEPRGRTRPPTTHAAVGARILASQPDTTAADIVREHHTPWSYGSLNGSPAAVLGARVLATAEKYDELRYGTVDTPGLGTHAATVEALRPLVGTQLDPAVTAAVIETAAQQELRSAS